MQPAFYPALPFNAVATAAERKVSFAARGFGTGIDRALDAIEGGATIVMITLPPLGYPDDVDRELAELPSTIGRRLAERGAAWAFAGRHLESSDIGYIDTHVSSGTLATTAFARSGIKPIFADTPEVVQGRQAPIIIAKHPLSGRATASSFDVKSGRLCVMLSRHQLACIIVTRVDVDVTLSHYEHDGSERRAGRHDDVWDGYTAHRTLYDALKKEHRVFTM